MWKPGGRQMPPFFCVPMIYDPKGAQDGPYVWSQHLREQLTFGNVTLEILFH